MLVCVWGGRGDNIFLAVLIIPVQAPDQTICYAIEDGNTKLGRRPVPAKSTRAEVL